MSMKAFSLFYVSIQVILVIAMTYNLDVDVTIGCYQGNYSSWDNVALRMLM